jgi:hypothetical protein
MAAETEQDLTYAERSFGALRDAQNIVSAARSNQMITIARVVLLVGSAIVYSLSDIADKVDELRYKR